MKASDQHIVLLKPEGLFDFLFREQWTMKTKQSFGSFHINPLKDAIDDLKFPIPPHRKTVFDFIFLTKGSSKRSKGLHDYEFSENTFFFLPAFQITTHQYLTADSEGFFCHFDTQIFDDVFPHNTFFDDFSFLNFYGEPTVEITKDMANYFLTILNRLNDIYLSPQKTDLKLVSLLLISIFKELDILGKHQKRTPHNAAYILTKKFKDLLTKHIYETKKVSDYADMLLVSPDYLNRSVKATTGKTARDVLTDMIILEAKVMLKQSNMNINDIAFKLSETNPSDFIRLFKKKTGITPKKYKN